MIKKAFKRSETSEKKKSEKDNFHDRLRNSNFLNKVHKKQKQQQQQQKIIII